MDNCDVEGLDKDSLKKLNEARSKINELEKAFQQTKTGIWEYDTETRVINWSTEVYKIYGLDEGTTPPRLEEIIRYSSKEEQSRIEDIITTAMVNGTPYSVFCEIETKNGEKKYVRATGSTTIDKNGHVKRLFGTICDLSDHYENQLKLQFSDFTIESISDGVYWFDNDLRFIRVNKAACEILGYSKEELIGKRGIDINPSFSVEKSKALWEETQRKGKLTFITNHKKKNGEVIPVEITNNIISWGGQNFKCSIVRDITDRKAQEEKLLSAFNEIEGLKNRLEKENVYLREEIKTQYNFDEIVASDRTLGDLLKKVEQVSKTSSTVLILGETGTGKELFARAIHNLSDRKNNAMIKINCAALPPQLAESELFGHEKGAFTGALAKKIGKFELAEGSTLFLDEIGDLPMDIQAKLLRVLQEGEFERVGGNETIKVDVRLIAATNKNLEKSVEEKEFREDLFYRLNVFPIYPPPLRERKSDIPALVRHFVEKFESRMGKRIESVPMTTMEKLKKYDWPGNIRELENVIERAMITSENVLEISDFYETKKHSKKASKLEDQEKEIIINALREAKGKVSGIGGAAGKLGVNAKTLESKIRKFKINKKEL